MDTDNHNISLVLIMCGEDFYLCQDVTHDDDILDIINRVRNNFNIHTITLEFHIGKTLYSIILHKSLKPT